MVLSMPVAVLLLTFMIVQDLKPERAFLGIPPIVVVFLLHLATLFIVAMVCHGELARARPATPYLTRYFLCMSIGGVLGGTFNALIAPVIFNSVTEYQLVMVIACMLMPAGLDSQRGLNRYFDNGLALALAVVGLYAVAQIAKTLLRTSEENPALDFGTLVANYSYIPGIKPGLTAVVLWSALVVGLLIYMGPPTLAWLVQRTRSPAWLDRYVNGRASAWSVRYLDVLLPLGLFLMTAELIRQNPFEHWKFQAFCDLFNVKQPRLVQVVTYGLPIGLCYAFAEQPIRFGLGVGAIMLGASWQGEQTNILHQERSFFGVLKVEKQVEPIGTYHRLLHGTTLHGMQLVGSSEPLTYFHKTGPIGQAYQVMLADDHAKDDVAIIGLGTGTLACYINPGQTATFYEIDRTVIRISQDMGFFTFLKDARQRGGDYRFEIGDARLKLRDARAHQYRLIVVDAFSSDAIPIHLITKEAVQLYFDKLTEDGLVCIHISNRYLGLAPVLGNIAHELDLVGLEQYDSETRVGAALFPAKSASDWVVLARKQEVLDRLMVYNSFHSIQSLLEYPEQLKQQGWIRHGEKAQTYQNIFQLNALGALLGANALQFAADESYWEYLAPAPSQRTWTDDYSNIISIFRWR
jgi:spermidine synthase